METGQRLSAMAMRIAKARPAHLEAALYLWQEAHKAGDGSAMGHLSRGADYLQERKSGLRTFFHNDEDETAWKAGYADLVREHCTQADARQAVSDLRGDWLSVPHGNLYEWALGIVKHPGGFADIPHLSLAFSIAQTIEAYDFRWHNRFLRYLPSLIAQEDTRTQIGLEMVVES